MDLDPKQQAFWRFLSLTVYNIHIESAQTHPDLRRLVVLINTLDVNIERSAISRSSNNKLEVAMLERRGHDHKRSSTGRDDVIEYRAYGTAGDVDDRQGLRKTESLVGPKDSTQSGPRTGRACRLLKHRHTGDNTAWQAYKVEEEEEENEGEEDEVDEDEDEEGEEDRNNDCEPVKAIDIRQAARKGYYWREEKAACCDILKGDMPEARELCF
ncbi:hypothetical protein N0V91_011115 [Didymella pomorum]|uniref:Uncharacterized protein n=1 Tax=Didymella pomorum TaxID=749634 RepID=A0A9W8Z1W5_9PLEO|nr:hypothetical protein N0V91_011115 [Didymella pomorum]